MYDPRLENLDAQLRFGTRVESPGRIRQDYQTITDFLPTADGRFKVKGTTLSGPASKLRTEGVEPATIVSPRAYLEDAAFLVAFEQSDGGNAVLDECAKALQQPKWPLFLGRKACIPTRPIYEAFNSNFEDLEDALRRQPWSWLGAANSLRRIRLPSSQLDAFIEIDDQAIGLSISIRQDAMRVNSARVYAFRTVKHIRVDFPAEQKG